MKYHLHRILTDQKLSFGQAYNDGGYYILCRDYLNLKVKDIFYIDDCGIIHKITIPYGREKDTYPSILIESNLFYRCEVS